MKTSNKPPKRRRDGFSLLELMVALLIFSFVVAGLYSIFNTSQNVQAVGLDLSEAQQNARIALSTVEKELRLAGFGIDHTVQVPILVASEYRVTFVRDLNGNGAVDLGETFTYFLDPNTSNFMVSVTPNPRDMVLRRVVSDNWNPTADPISGSGAVLAAGITQQTDDNGTLDVSLFTYYDASSNSLIDAGTYDPFSTSFGYTVSDSAALGKPAGGPNPVSIVTIGITIVAECEAIDQFQGDYERVRISSTISPRNFPLNPVLAAVNN